MWTFAQSQTLKGFLHRENIVKFIDLFVNL